MDNTVKPKPLDYDLITKRELLFRCFHAYSRAYHDMLWQLDEVSLLIKTARHSEYNTWMLNEALYKYSETSIAALNWLLGGTKNHPFVHQFLRMWRNEYHHQSIVDFQLFDMRIQVNGEPHNCDNEYLVLPIVIQSERLKKLLKDWFACEGVATNATVNGLVKHHHIFMLSSFKKFENDMQHGMPKEYLTSGGLFKSSYGGGKYEIFINEDEFWSYDK